MKWVIGALIAAVVWSIATGRVSGTWLIYVFSILFASVAAGMVFAFWRRKHYGFLLLAATYFTAALSSLVLLEFWPLIVGLGLAWVFRMMGVEPAREDLPDPEVETPAVDSEKKT